jgi:lipopolysaccharide export system protein LptA
VSAWIVRLLAAVGLTAGLLTAAGHAVVDAAAPAAQQLSVTADTMDIDAATRVLTATGHVRISDGRTTATAMRATLFQREGRGVLAGEARVRSPQGVLGGNEITVDYTTALITRITASGAASLDAEEVRITAQTIVIVPTTDTMTAHRDVTFSAKPDIVATGAELTYQRSMGVTTLQGQARLRSRDGVIESDRIESYRHPERLVATGNVHGVYRDIDVRSRAAEVLGAEKMAVFTGEVQLVQPGRRLTSEKVTVWYAARRVAAEGQTWMRIEPTP